MYKESFDLDKDQWKRFISTYQLLIENTDKHIGQLLESIDEKGIKENTIVLFTTDHGEMAGSHKLIAKTTFYEESSKTPVIIRYPKMINPKSINNNALVGTIDIMPTLLDLAGVPIPNEIDGRSFKNEILNPNGDTNFDVLFSQNQFGRMVRYDNYKYVRSVVYGLTYEILYDINNDPLESKNLVNIENHKNPLNKGRKLLDDWLETENTVLVTRN